MIPAFVDNVVLRVAELDRTERFYTAVLAESPRRAEDSLMYQLGDVRVFFTACRHQRQEPYDKENVGLNHVAFGVPSLEELHAIHTRLRNHGPATQIYPVTRILSAVFVAYLTNAWLVVGTEQLLGRLFFQTRYFVADVLTQSAIQVGFTAAQHFVQRQVFIIVTNALPELLIGSFYARTICCCLRCNPLSPILGLLGFRLRSLWVQSPG